MVSIAIEILETFDIGAAHKGGKIECATIPFLFSNLLAKNTQMEFKQEIWSTVYISSFVSQSISLLDQTKELSRIWPRKGPLRQSTSINGGRIPAANENRGKEKIETR